MNRGNLIVISGPSGAGKSTVVSRAMTFRNDICFSTSVTTRKPRPGEVDGVDYFFIDQSRFDEMVRNNELLEHAVYVSNSYGTPAKFVDEQLEKGMNVILDIEIQGAAQVHSNKPEAVMIFIIPPSIDELRKRLTGRGTENEETIEARIQRAIQECREADFYDYIIINDDLDKASEDLSSIMNAELCRFEKKKDVLYSFGK